MVFEETSNDVGVEENLLKAAENNGKSKRRSDGFFMYFCVLSVNSFMFLTGCSYSWTSPVLLKLYSNDTNINPLGAPITKLQESLVAGIPFLGCLIGPLFLSKLTQTFGRKTVLAAFGGFEILSFMLLTIGSKIWIYYLSRFLVGVGYGITMPLSTIYITEISPAHNRGRYGIMIGLFIPLGNLCSYVIGPMFSVQLFSFICVLPCLIIYPFILWFVPDSPTSLVSKGNVEKARVVLQKLRNEEQVAEELEDILSMSKKQEQETTKKVNIKNLLDDRVSVAGLKIAIGMSSVQIFSGIIVIMAFVGPIFQTVNNRVSGNAIAILFGIVKLISLIFTAVVIERFQRKTLLIYSAISTSICLFILGVYFYLQDVKHIQNIEQFSWIPITCVLLYVVFHATGLGPVAHILYGEIFPGRFKAVAVSILSVGYTLLSFFLTFSFRFAIYYFGTHVVFWLFSLSCFLGIFFIHFKVPETRGKSLLEIQRTLNKL